MAISFLGILSVAADVAGLRSFVASLRADRTRDELLASIGELRRDVQRLSERDYYLSSRISPSVPVFREDAGFIAAAIGPISATLGMAVLASDTHPTPDRLRRVIAEEPKSLLLNIQPLGRFSFTANEDLVPVVFMQGGKYLVGWQTRGALKHGFGYDVPRPQATLQVSPASTDTPHDPLGIPRALTDWAREAFPGYVPGDPATYKYLLPGGQDKK